MHLVATQLAVADDRQLRAAPRSPSALHSGAPYCCCRARVGELVNRLQHDFGEVAEVMADLLGVNFLRQFGAGDHQRLFALEQAQAVEFELGIALDRGQLLLQAFATGALCRSDRIAGLDQVFQQHRVLARLRRRSIRCDRTATPVVPARPGFETAVRSTRCGRRWTKTGATGDRTGVRSARCTQRVDQTREQQAEALPGARRHVAPGLGFDESIQRVGDCLVLSILELSMKSQC